MSDYVIQKTNLKFDETKLVQRNLKKILLIILHHTASLNGDAYSIHRDHLKRGWAGIGYHYLILQDGTIQEGRPIKYVGSHCAGNNTSSIGIALLGDFRKVQPTKEQIDALNLLVDMLKERVPSIYKVLNHNDLYATACPVVNLKELVK